MILDSGNPDSAEGPSSNSTRRKGRRQGKRGGVLVKLRKRQNRPPLPSIFLANVRSLRHKVDELHGLMNAHRDYRDCSAYFITDSWLDNSVPDSAIQSQTPGFTLHRSDRLFSTVNKECGGGVCILVNDSWCNNTKVLSRTCTSELETLVIKCRPFYLPRVFIHPSF